MTYSLPVLILVVLSPVIVGVIYATYCLFERDLIQKKYRKRLEKEAKHEKIIIKSKKTEQSCPLCGDIDELLATKVCKCGACFHIVCLEEITNKCSTPGCGEIYSGPDLIEVNDNGLLGYNSLSLPASFY